MKIGIRLTKLIKYDIISTQKYKERFLTYILYISKEFQQMEELGKKMLQCLKKTRGIYSVNAEAKALFNAVQEAFTGTKEIIPVPSDLIAMMAACSWVALEYDKEQEIPLAAGNHDYILLRAADEFVKFLVIAVRQNYTWEPKDTKAIYCGGFEIPQWVIDIANDSNQYDWIEQKDLESK